MKKFTHFTGMFGAFLILTFAWKGLPAGTNSSAANSSPAAQFADSSQRHFVFTYQVRVPDLPASPSPLRIWIPVPTSDSWQTITNLSIESPIAHRITKENQFGNSMAYFVVKLDRPQPAIRHRDALHGGSQRTSRRFEQSCTERKFSRRPAELNWRDFCSPIVWCRLMA